MRQYFFNFWLRLAVFFLPCFCYFLENLIESCWYIHYLTASFPVESGGSPERVKSSLTVFCWHELAMSRTLKEEQRRRPLVWELEFVEDRRKWSLESGALVMRLEKPPAETNHAGPLLLYFQHLELWAINAWYLSDPVFGGPLDCTSSLRNGLRSWFLNFRLYYSCPFNIPFYPSVLGLDDVNFEVVHNVSQLREFTTHIIFL